MIEIKRQRFGIYIVCKDGVSVGQFWRSTHFGGYTVFKNGNVHVYGVSSMVGAVASILGCK